MEARKEYVNLAKKVARANKKGLKVKTHKTYLGVNKYHNIKII
jgi:hypothetical protein